MGKAFSIIDWNGDRKIDNSEFYQGIQELGANITKREGEILLAAMDTNRDGVVSYDEFLVALRGRPNQVR